MLADDKAARGSNIKSHDIYITMDGQSMAAPRSPSTPPRQMMVPESPNGATPSSSFSPTSRLIDALQSERDGHVSSIAELQEQLKHARFEVAALLREKDAALMSAAKAKQEQSSASRTEAQAMKVRNGSGGSGGVLLPFMPWALAPPRGVRCMHA